MQPQFEKFNEQGYLSGKENLSQERVEWNKARDEYNRICIECERAVEAKEDPEEKKRAREGYKERIEKAMKDEWTAHHNWVESLKKETTQLSLKDFMERNRDN